MEITRLFVIHINESSVQGVLTPKCFPACRDRILRSSGSFIKAVPFVFVVLGTQDSAVVE